MRGGAEGLRGVAALALAALALGGCGDGAGGGCPAGSWPDVACAPTDAGGGAPGDAADVAFGPDTGAAIDSGGTDAAGADAATADVPPAPTYWSAAATAVVDDLVFAEHDGQRIFALGFDARKGPIWDGVTGPRACDEAAGAGYLPFEVEWYDRALLAGANYTFIWSYPSADWPWSEEWLDRISQFYGNWYEGYGRDRPAERDVIPLLYNAFGESDFDNDDIEGTIAAHEARFEEWRSRTGRYSSERAPTLPPFEELPWMAWHPTWRSRGGGDGTGEVLTDEQARGLINATNAAIGDNYTYVTNRHDALFNALTGQRGERGEGYDDWLAVADPEHASLFQGAWEVAYALERFAEHRLLRWMWIQGYSFGWGAGAEICRKGASDAWAGGWYPSLPYLRKEVASAIAAGVTGIVYFGYLDAHPVDREKADTIFRALSHRDVYGPALLSPRLDLGPREVLLHAGEGGRVHAVAKWDPDSRRAFLIGANPGPWQTTVDVTFPWSLAKAEVLMWGSGRFVESPRLTLRDGGRTLRFVAPMDEGFILRLTPLFAPGAE
jgi:hypothetical protein